mgnify:CR=1 FL=1
MKFAKLHESINRDARGEINLSILQRIEANKITKREAFQQYTAKGGLHDLQFNQFGSFHDYTSAKKEIENGQFFTPIEVVEKITKVVNPIGSVLDPCCGSGGFLIKAFEYVRDKIEGAVQLEKERIKKEHFGSTYGKLPEKQQEAIAKKQSIHEIPLSPAYTPSEDNIDHSRFSYITIHYKKENKSQTDNYILFDTSAGISELLATRFGKQRYPEGFIRVDVAPRNYKRKARVLLKEGKVIAGTPHQKVTPVKKSIPPLETHPKDKYANKHGIYTKETAKDRYETLTLPFPKSAHFFDNGNSIFSNKKHHNRSGKV